MLLTQDCGVLSVGLKRLAAVRAWLDQLLGGGGSRSDTPIVCRNCTVTALNKDDCAL